MSELRPLDTGSSKKNSATRRRAVPRLRLQPAARFPQRAVGALATNRGLVR